MPTTMRSAACAVLMATLVVATLATPAAATSFHGAEIQKNCTGPAVCDPMGVGIARRGDPITCTVRVTNVDDFGDPYRVDALCDAVHHAGGDVEACLAGLPATLPIRGASVALVHADTVGPTDPAPLADLGTSHGADTGTGQPFELAFPGQVAVVECCADGDCTTDACGVGACVDHACVRTPRAAGTVCRAPAGACDVAETCDGVHLACPADALLPSTTVCRAAAGPCDVQEWCTGTSAACPADGMQAPNAACPDDGNPCTRDVCDGTHAACQHPAGNAGTPCRASAGVCDVAESCDGTHSTCPADAKAAAGTTCADDGNPCTRDVCDGTGNACTHPAGNAGAVCRGASGECDVAETCTGTSTACPADAKAKAGTACADTDGLLCTTAACDGYGTCNQRAVDACGAGCRVTGGGVAPDGGIDLGSYANISKATFGGQIGAPCGCIGTFDTLGRIQGNWTHSRKTQKATFKAIDYNSLVCGCDGKFDGKLCPATSPSAPANSACFSGIGSLSTCAPTQVVFRAETVDRGDPGTSDAYRLRIWIPTSTTDRDALLKAVACTIATPSVRAPTVDDGGTLVGGNIQIHPQISSTTCPPPSGSCTP